MPSDLPSPRRKYVIVRPPPREGERERTLGDLLQEIAWRSPSDIQAVRTIAENILDRLNHEQTPTKLRAG